MQQTWRTPVKPIFWTPLCVPLFRRPSKDFCPFHPVNCLLPLWNPRCLWTLFFVQNCTEMQLLNLSSALIFLRSPHMICSKFGHFLLLIWLVLPAEFRKVGVKFVFPPHTKNWPTTLWKNSYNTTSTTTASLGNKQEWKIPQSLGSGLGMRKTKNNLQTKWKFPFPIFPTPCIPQSSLPYFSSSTTGSSGKRKGRKISKNTTSLRWNFLLQLQNEGSFENYFT